LIGSAPISMLSPGDTRTMKQMDNTTKGRDHAMDIPRILLVDDRRENILVLEAILERPDLDIFFATSGNEALSLLLDYEFALVLLDVQMPGMDGFETAEMIRCREKTMHTPIIFVTAISKDERYVFAGYEKGAVDYLSKPIDEAILRSKVNVFVDLYNQKKSLEKAYAELRTALDELEQSNKTILENQRTLIEDERIKLLLQVSGATAREMNDPLNTILQGLDSLKSHAEQCGEHCAEALEDLERIREAGLVLRGIANRVQEIPVMEPGRSGGSFPSIRDRSITILCIDDDEGFFCLLTAMLTDFPYIHMVYAGSCGAAEELLSKPAAPDVVLLDHSLPDGDSFRIMTFLRQRDMDIPVVVITGQRDEIVAARLIKLGAADYLPKSDIRGQRLAESIHGAIEQYQLRKDLKKTLTIMTDMATRDGLTGLYNRRYFVDALEREISREERYHGGLSLCIIDIDFFKSINDTYGHTAGDKVLKKLSEIMTEVTRGTDIVCRYGGEEFAIAFPNTGEAKAYGICERFNSIVEQYEFTDEKAVMHVTVSIGLAGFASGGEDSMTRLIERADRELYRAKEGGRNRICRTSTEQGG
jgi:two-component system, cell cycle response regulator